jgi:hypothetical protein
LITNSSHSPFTDAHHIIYYNYTVSKQHHWPETTTLN